MKKKRIVFSRTCHSSEKIISRYYVREISNDCHRVVYERLALMQAGVENLFIEMSDQMVTIAEHRSRE